MFGAAGDPYNAADYAFNIHGEEVKVAPSFRYLGVEMPRAIDTASVAPIEPVRREDILARRPDEHAQGCVWHRSPHAVETVQIYYGCVLGLATYAAGCMVRADWPEVEEVQIKSAQHM